MSNKNNDIAPRQHTDGGKDGLSKNDASCGTLYDEPLKERWPNYFYSGYVFHEDKDSWYLDAKAQSNSTNSRFLFRFRELAGFPQGSGGMACPGDP